MIGEKKLKVLIVQNNPILMQKKQNIRSCSQMIKKYTSKDLIDIVMFPEMSFTGYNFENYNHALKMAAQKNEGEDFEFVKSIAKQLNSYIVFGYIQKVKNNKQNCQVKQASNKEKQMIQLQLQIVKQYILFNAGAVIDRSGNLLVNFHKTHLYNCDQLWAQQGQGFQSIQIKNLNGDSFNCALGICMDINQKKFTSQEFEWADFVNKIKAEVLLLLSNWTDSSPQTNTKKDSIYIYNYWLYRLMPVINENNGKKVMFVSDRVGKEFNYNQKKQGYFHGNSGAVYLNPCQLISFLDKRQERTILIQAQLPKIN